MTRGIAIRALIVVPLLCCLALPLGAADSFQRRVFTENGKNLPYCLLPPATIEAGQVYPMLLFLHGSGERGSDNRGQLTYCINDLTKPEWRKKYPCYLVVPQCPAGRRWVEVEWSDVKPHKTPVEPSEPMALMISLLPSLQKELPIDRSRLYIMGMSMGGYGTWDFLARKPEWFAAGVPICGGADNSMAPRMAKIPLWVFHGAVDPIVPVIRAHSMVDALRAAGGTPKYSEYPGVNHGSWNNALAEPDLMPWLFSQQLAPDKPARK